jgi:hypothetical protein
MRLRAIYFLVVVACFAAGWAAYSSSSPTIMPLSHYVPAGGLLYLEAKDLSSLLASWNASAEKSNWVQSANYEAFSRSRLVLRLKAAGQQFSAAAGLPADMNLLTQVGGSRSVLALYDIGNLQFLYITYLPTRSVETTLWQTREKFEPRSAGGMNFYLRHDPESQREVVFAVQGDYLLIATREDLIAGALQLLSGIEGHSVESEPWWSRAVAAAGPNGDLRMVLNLEKLVPTSFFRSYWVQQNITEMKQYSTAIADLFRSPDQDREERVLILKDAASAPNPAATQATADLISLVPEGSGIYSAKASPSSAFCFKLVKSKLLEPQYGPAPKSKFAPQVQLTGGEAGASTELETRIDQPPTNQQRDKAKSALEQLLEEKEVLAALEVESTAADSDGIFVRPHSAIVLVGSSDWNRSRALAAISDFLAPSVSANHMGLAWQARSGYQELDGLWPLAMAVQGPYLVLANDPALLATIWSRFNRRAENKPVTLVAHFDHRHEGQNLSRMAAIVDRNRPSQRALGESDHQPQFFSENLGSLSQAFGRIAWENVVVRTEGNKVLETVTYQWSE